MQAAARTRSRRQRRSSLTDMASTAVLLYTRPQAIAATAGARSSAAVMYSSARLVSGVYTPQIRSTSARRDAWRPRTGLPIGHAVVNGQKVPVVLDAAFSRYLDTLEDRLGGINGQRLPDVVTTVEAAQTSSAETAQRTQAIAQQAAANAATLDAARQVLQNAGIPGSDQIPPPVLDGGNYFVP